MFQGILSGSVLLTRHLGVVLALFIVSATFIATGTARAAYVLYFHTFGDWGVICSTDESNKQNWCTLSSPPPTEERERASSRIIIAEHPTNGLTVSLKIRGSLEPGLPAFLRVDGNAPHRTSPDQFGETKSAGIKTSELIRQFQRGRNVVLRSFARGTGAPRDELFSIVQFNQALKTYREKMRFYNAMASQP